jgi:threonine/homoserine/homoserine lactone efflux protein
MTEFFISAVVLGIVVAIPPGSVTLVACQRSLQFGFRNSMWFTLGSSLSDTFYILLVWFGVAGAVSALPWFKPALFVVCGLLLVWMGLSSILPLLKRDATDEDLGELVADPRATVVQGVLVTLTTPLTIVGWLAVAGNFFLLWGERLPESRNWGLATVALIMLGVLVWFVPLIFAVSRLRALVGPRLKRGLIIGANLGLVAFGAVALWSAVEIFLGWSQG